MCGRVGDTAYSWHDLDTCADTTCPQYLRHKSSICNHVQLQKLTDHCCKSCMGVTALSSDRRGSLWAKVVRRTHRARPGHRPSVGGLGSRLRAGDLTLIHCVSRPGHGWPGIFRHPKCLKMEPSKSRASWRASSVNARREFNQQRLRNRSETSGTVWDGGRASGPSGGPDARPPNGSVVSDMSLRDGGGRSRRVDPGQRPPPGRRPGRILVGHRNRGPAPRDAAAPVQSP
jgi:hypothetical protein